MHCTLALAVILKTNDMKETNGKKALELKLFIEKYNFSKEDVIKLSSLEKEKNQLGFFAKDKVKREIIRIYKHYKVKFLDYGDISACFKQLDLLTNNNFKKIQDIEIPTKEKINHETIETEKETWRDKIKAQEEELKRKGRIRREEYVEKNKVMEEEYAERNAERKKELLEKSRVSEKNKHLITFKENKLNKGEQIISVVNAIYKNLNSSASQDEYHGVLIITEQRVAFYAKESLLFKEIYKSMPLRQISSIEYIGGWLSKKMHLVTNIDQIEVSFSAHKHVIQEFQKTLESKREEIMNSTNSEPAAVITVESIPDQIKKLAELKDLGILTADEFDLKKQHLLDKI
jgi:hypothetical protein